MIRLLIVDDQKILLEGLKKIFEGQRHIEVVSTLSFSELVEPACNRFRPDAVLLDICMEGKNSGIALTRRLKKKYPGQKVIIMTGFQDVSFIEMARDAGADSFIYKESAAHDFLDCLERTLSGEHLFPDVREKVTFGACHISLTDRGAGYPASGLSEPVVSGNRRCIADQQADCQFPHQQYAQQDGPQKTDRPGR